MRIKILLMIIMTALLFIGGRVYADDAKDFPITGTVELGVRSVQDGDKSAKFQEYRDLKSGVFGNMRFGGGNDSYYLNLTGENVGRDDQFFQVQGGKYGSFNYTGYYNEIIHNLSFGAKTFYANPGSNNLTYGNANTPAASVTTTYVPSVSTDAGNWNTFDYSIKRKDTGAAVDFSFGTPFYISVDANHLEVKGIQPRGVPSDIAAERKSSSTGSGGIELPQPVDYYTNNLNLKTGYNTKKYSFSVGGSLSRFENQNEFVSFRNPYVVTQTQMERFSEGPDNSYYKLMAEGAIRQLPLNSALALKVGWSKLESRVDLLREIPRVTAGSTTTLPTYSTQTLSLNTPQFAGDIKYQTASVALTSEPVKAMDTKVYFNSVRKTNDSTQIEYSSGTSTLDNELFNYRKWNAGLDVGYRISPKNKATVGYDFQQTDRERLDAESTTDRTVYGEFKNSSLSWLTAKAKVQRLWRGGDFQAGAVGNNLDKYRRRFDSASKIQDSFKLAFDIDPIDNFNVGLEYKLKQDTYEDDFYGRTSERRNEYFTDLSYEIPDVLRFTVFFDYEVVNAKAKYSSSSALTSTSSSTSATYHYWGDYKDSNYAYGLGLRAPVIKNKLDLVTSWTYEQANGQYDYSTPNEWGAATYVDSNVFDDYMKQRFDFKAIYKAIKNLELTLGYAYEHYNYEDLSTMGYRYTIASTSINPSYFFSGAYADGNYNVSMVYLMANYNF